MSGGHFEYIGRGAGQSLCEIAIDKNVRERFSVLANLFQQLGEKVARIEHDLDWDFSGDKGIKERDIDFEKSAIADLLEVCMKASPDEWFPRGKWATIQAIQGRVNDGR